MEDRFSSQFFEIFDPDMPLDPRDVADFICSHFDGMALANFINEIKINEKIRNSK